MCVIDFSPQLLLRDDRLCRPVLIFPRTVSLDCNIVIRQEDFSFFDEVDVCALAERECTDRPSCLQASYVRR